MARNTGTRLKTPWPPAVRFASWLVVVAVAVATIAVVDNMITDTGTGSQAEEPAPAVEPRTSGTSEDRGSSESLPEGPRDGHVDSREFASLTEGTTIMAADRIIGGPGTVIEEQGELGDPGHRVTLRWEGTDEGSHVTATFVEGGLVERSETGLRER